MCTQNLFTPRPSTPPPANIDCDIIATSKLLLRHGFVFAGKTAWSRQYWQWLRRIRAEAVPTPVATHADKGNRRLHARWEAMKIRKKKNTVITAAAARETAGWCQALVMMDARENPILVTPHLVVMQRGR